MTPTQDYRRTHLHRERAIYSGLDAQAHRVARFVRQRRCRRLRAEAEAILEAHRKLGECGEGELEAQLWTCRAQMRRTAGADPAAVQAALATLMEAARRHTGLTAHPEQLMGALALSRGFLAEMLT